MRDLRDKMKEFHAFKGYFFSDKRALCYIRQNSDAWDMNSVNSRVGVLGLTRLMPDYLLGKVVQILASNAVQQAVIDGDFKIFDVLHNDLLYLDSIKFIITKFLCAHRPDHFPIWDEKKSQIGAWSQEDENFSYLDLKQRIDNYRVDYDLNDLNYFFFNKLLWYCD